MSTTVTSTVQEMPLRVLTAPSTGQDDQETTEQQGGSGSPRYAVQVREDRADGDTGSPAEARPALDESPVATTARRPERRDNRGQTNPIYRFLVYTPVGNAIAILALFLALLFGLFTGISTYIDMKWSEHNDAVDTCISLYVRYHPPRLIPGI